MRKLKKKMGKVEVWRGEEGGQERKGKKPVHDVIIITTAPGVIEVNPEFEITKITDLLELSNWAHHTTYILPQVGIPVPSPL